MLLQKNLLRLFSIKFTKPMHIQQKSVVKITNRMALNMAMDEQLERDKNVVIIGQEVGQYNGAYKITNGLAKKHGFDRVRDTPITQTGFTGISVGAAMKGLKPIVEFMTMNFVLQAIDSIVNSAAKTCFHSMGKINIPMVFRGLNGPAASVAAQHSQCFASWFAHIPGLIVISPYDAEDCKGLLKSAIRDNNPVIFLQNQILYGQYYQILQSKLHRDYLVPIGKAKIMKQGTDVTLVGYSRMVKICLQAAEYLQQQGISCQVINLRTIRPMDRQAIIDSVKKTSRIVVVQDGFPQSGVSSQIASLLFESEAFWSLDCPMSRVTALQVPMPYSNVLQPICTPKKQSVIQAVHQMLNISQNNT